MSDLYFNRFIYLPGLTALENVALPLELNGDADALATAKTYLDRVGLERRTTHYPRQLSGGEQQRVAVARAFACKPTILFADEPTGNLDTATGEIINDLLFDLNREEGTTLVLVTHEMNLAARCHRTMQLQAGRQEDTADVATTKRGGELMLSLRMLMRTRRGGEVGLILWSLILAVAVVTSVSSVGRAH